GAARRPRPEAGLRDRRPHDLARPRPHRDDAPPARAAAARPVLPAVVGLPRGPARDRPRRRLPRADPVGALADARGRRAGRLDRGGRGEAGGGAAAEGAGRELGPQAAAPAAVAAGRTVRSGQVPGLRRRQPRPRQGTGIPRSMRRLAVLLGALALLAAAAAPA